MKYENNDYELINNKWYVFVVYGIFTDSMQNIILSDKGYLLEILDDCIITILNCKLRELKLKKILNES